VLAAAADMSFTREITTAHHFPLLFLDEALAGLHPAVEARLSAALIAPAGTAKTALLRCLRDGLPGTPLFNEYIKLLLEATFCIH
jgi:hypothetical protein